MSDSGDTTHIPNNKKVVEDITKDLESQLSVNDIHRDHGKNDNSEAGAERVDECDTKSCIPEDFEHEEGHVHDFDDYIDEAQLKDLEVNLSESEIESRHIEALELKTKGNEEFKDMKYLESISTYTKALKVCPLRYKNDRSILYANRGASKVKLDRTKSAIDDCSQAIELNDVYLKAYLRRAKLYEVSDKLDESLEDYKKILIFDPNNPEALKAVYRLPPLIQERNEKLKTEMLGKLKDLGNVILKPFGLSTDNFQLNQDPNSGGYSINFAQNSNK